MEGEGGERCELSESTTPTRLAKVEVFCCACPCAPVEDALIQPWKLATLLVGYAALKDVAENSGHISPRTGTLSRYLLSSRSQTDTLSKPQLALAPTAGSLSSRLRPLSGETGEGVGRTGIEKRVPSKLVVRRLIILRTSARPHISRSYHSRAPSPVSNLKLDRTCRGFWRGVWQTQLC